MSKSYGTGTGTGTGEFQYCKYGYGTRTRLRTPGYGFHNTIYVKDMILLRGSYPYQRLPTKKVITLHITQLPHFSSQYWV